MRPRRQDPLRADGLEQGVCLLELITEQLGGRPIFKAALFDFDDTLVESFSARTRAAQKAADGILDSGLDLEKIMRESAGRPQRDIWFDLSGDERETESLMEGYRTWYWGEFTDGIVLFPGIRDLLDELKSKGVALAVVTSKIRLRTHDGEPYGAEVEMSRLGLDGVFDLVVGWGDVEESKPDPGPILFALDTLAVDRRDALMIGDSHVDIVAAKRAGVASAAADWGTLARDLLIEAGPDYVVTAPSELRALFP